ncbi:ATP-binding cassette, subfamily C, CydD [Modicisalibacter ilicicola DSM 19980]|uniref:ATP-binding cassette, subfamily C, CydD n=1 Tax=Modicisalibacter ilicicola DSM 19980 TaxID=1121942 RepID=A0A1M5CJQ7_9GAMM|nr:thiol reductant ABC exporter subunit CydD [Halomonas ilicicola]SHF54984.1 ATP-binding cassette, subfamily C, CydD [Halomonas ilicicola DSM 19980]
MPPTPAAEDELTPRAWLHLQAREIRGWLWLSSVLGVLAGLMTLLQMALLAWVVSRLIDGEAPPGTLTTAFGALAGVIVLRALAQWGQESAGVEASWRVRRRVRAMLLDHLAALGPTGLSDRHPAGLGGQLVEQVEALDGYFARFLPQLRLVMALPLVLLGVVLWLDWLAGVLLLLAAPLIPLFMALVGMGAERLNREQFVAVTRLAGHFLDRVRGLTTLQLFNRAERSVEEVFVAADDYRRRSMRTLRLAFLSSAVLEFFASVAIAMIAIYIGFGLLGYIRFGPADELTLFSGLLILLLAPEFFQPLRTLAQHYHDRAAALGAADGLVTLLNRPVPDGTEREGWPMPGAFDTPGARIRLSEASVAYPGREGVLGPLSLALEPGQCLAVVGPSGAGKSTLLRLLAGFAHAEQGRVEVVPAAPIAWMDQRPWLVQGSLADNLRLAAPEASDEQLGAALSRVGLDGLLATLPEGLATPLGERGLGVSGGQAQRLALGRVFLSEAPLVLLDEPTANLDEASEAQIVASLRDLKARGRTLVVATHHPALIALADRVLSIERGMLGERTARSHDATP